MRQRREAGLVDLGELELPPTRAGLCPQRSEGRSIRHGFAEPG